MTFVVSEGSVRTLARPAGAPATQMTVASDFVADYAAIWRTQPAVRTCVSFLARNIASLGLHTFQRLSDTDRRRLTDHPLAALLSRPNARTTRYRLFSALVHDRGIYDRAYWLKVRNVGLVRIPPQFVTPVGDNWLWPEAFQIQGTKSKVVLPADRFVHFRGYDPLGADGCSPLEGLRRMLAEDFEAGRMREQVLRNGARVSGYLSRPKEAGSWSREARDRFGESWRRQYTGGGPGAGGTPILEDGMTFVPASQTAEELQYIEARKLTRLEAAQAYHIPPPMIGLLDNATFSNITEQHKMLYQDCLGPWLTEFEEELELQLLPDVDPTPGIYLEFNLAEKLKGSFEEQAKALQTMVGAPVMTRNEGRGRINLPALPDGDELVTPLNVLIGGQASPTDSAPDPAADEVEAPPKARDALRAVLEEVAGKGALDGLGVSVKARPPVTHGAKATQVLVGFLERQKRAVLSAIGAKGDGWWDGPRWDRELGGDLSGLALLTATEVAGKTAELLGFDPAAYDGDRTIAGLRALAAAKAAALNAHTEARIATYGSDSAGAVFTEVASKAADVALELVGTFASVGAIAAASQLAGDRARKTWRSGCATHSGLEGETVGIDQPFSTGAAHPTCSCSVEISIP